MIQRTLAFALLAIQILLPWTVPHFVTQDGPSHVYSAVVARDILLHRNTPQRALYHFRSGVTPNSTSTLILALFATLFGPANAERLMIGLIATLGFFGLRYAIAPLSSGSPPTTPVYVFLFHNWFLWLGFYNFCLGMALSLWVIGYFLRHRRTLTPATTAKLTGLVLLVFLTHLIPAALTSLTILIVTLWTAPRFTRLNAFALASLVPTAILAILYIGIHPHAPGDSQLAAYLEGFPMYTFATTSGNTGGQNILTSGWLFCSVIAALSLSRAQWRTEKGALVAAAFLSFVLYCAVPNEGFGGSETKIRFLWAMFIFLTVVAVAVIPERLALPIALLTSLLLACNFWADYQTLRNTSHAIADYSAIVDRIPKGAVFVRLNYRDLQARARYGISEIGRDPFFHADAYSAARIGSIDASDYEALDPIFLLAFRPAWAKANAGPCMPWRTLRQTPAKP